jgi:hypothetical protein
MSGRIWRNWEVQTRQGLKPGGDAVAAPFTTGVGHWAVVVAVVEASSVGTIEGVFADWMMTILVLVDLRPY